MTTRSKLGIALLALGISLSAMAMDLGQAMSALGGAKAQGLVGEQAPGLSVRFTGINRSAIASYLVTLYSSLAVLTEV